MLLMAVIIKLSPKSDAFLCSEYYMSPLCLIHREMPFNHSYESKEEAQCKTVNIAINKLCFCMDQAFPVMGQDYTGKLSCQNVNIWLRMFSP